MRALLFVAVVLAACTDPEEAVVKAGGAAPALCLRKDKSGATFCRDAKRALFVCFETGADASCVSVDRVRAVMSGALEVTP